MKSLARWQTAPSDIANKKLLCVTELLDWWTGGDLLVAAALESQEYVSDQ